MTTRTAQRTMLGRFIGWTTSLLIAVLMWSCIVVVIAAVWRAV